MHPLIRVVTLLVFITGMSLAQPLALSVGFGLLLIGYLIASFPALGKPAITLCNRVQPLGRFTVTV